MFFKRLLYSLLFIYSSLYASYPSSCSEAHGLVFRSDSGVYATVDTVSLSCTDHMTWNFPYGAWSSASDLGSGAILYSGSGTYTSYTPIDAGALRTVTFRYYANAEAVCPDGTELIDNRLCVVPPPPPGPDEDLDGDGILNKCDKDFAISNPDLYAIYDCDGDSETNDIDIDDDGDGILDTNDIDNVDFTDTENLKCEGADLSKNLDFYPSRLYNTSYYQYYGELTTTGCTDKMLLTNIDSVFIAGDKNEACESTYCFIHEIEPSCNFHASNYLPSPDWEYKPNTDEVGCSSLVDGVKYSDSDYRLPNAVGCPNTGFCFVKPVDGVPNDTNSEDEDSSMNELDLNSTTSDLAPLLQSSNTTNKHLQDLKDKTDVTNQKLDDLKDVNNKLLTNNQDMKSSLDKLSLNSDKSLKNQHDTNSKLDNINKGVSTSTNVLKDISKIGLNNNEKLGDISGKLTAINNGLYGENPFSDTLDDGLSTNLGNIDTTLKGSFNGFVQDNIFSFANQSYVIPTITFNTSFGNYTLFSPDTLSTLDIVSIRNLFMFVFALAGFITVFKTI